MSIIATPETHQTLPGRSRRYRLWTRDHCDWSAFEGTGTALVVCTRWGVSYTSTGAERPVLNVYDVSNIEEEGVEHHEINGTTYDTVEDARRAAFEAGLLAFMQYVDPPNDYWADRVVPSTTDDPTV